MASISPLAFIITLSPPATSKIIWSSVPNLILLSASLPISKLEFTTLVIPVCAALTSNSSFVLSAVKPTPAITSTSISKVTEPPSDTLPPFFKPSPAVIVTALFESFEFAIEPANWALVIVPLKLLVKYPVASAKSKAGVVSEPPNATVTPPKLTLVFVSAEFGMFVKVLLLASIDLLVKVSVDEIVGIVTSLSFNPPIHLSVLTSHNNEPVSAESASFT